MKCATLPAMEEVNEDALKHLFGKKLLRKMADSLAKAFPDFNREPLLKLFPELEKLEMKPRVYLIRDALRANLPNAFPKALRVLAGDALVANAQRRKSGGDKKRSDLIHALIRSQVALDLYRLRTS